MKHTVVIWIERVVIVILTAAILASAALWGAGYYDISFIPRQGTETKPPLPVIGGDETDETNETAEGTETLPAPTETVPVTSAPETQPQPPVNPGTVDLTYSALSALLEAGGEVTAHDFDGETMVLAKNTGVSCLTGVKLNVGSVSKSVIVRAETETAGIALRETTGLVPVRGVVPYMGYVIVRTDGDYYALLTASGEMLNEKFPSDVELTFARTEDGHPIVRSAKHYCYITSRGKLEPAVYTPDQNALTFDLDADYAAQIETYPKPFEEYVRVFTEVAEKDKVKGKTYYTSWQKELVEEGMDPAEALKMTEPPETEPEETDPPETEPEETEPEETEPEETEPEETEPEETEPEETEPPETDPPETEEPWEHFGPEETEEQWEHFEPEETGTGTEEIGPLLASNYLAPATVRPDTKTETAGTKWYIYEEGLRWGYRNASGKTVISPRFLYAYPFASDGWAAVIRYNDKVGTATLAFIDKNGKTKIDVAGNLLRDYTVNDADVYDGYYPCLANDETALGSYYFDHGFVRVRHRMVLRTKVYNAYIDEEILIDKNGKEFRLPDGYKLISYSDGILLLEKNGKYGYMNYRGEWIVQPVNTYAEPFMQGLGVIGSPGAIGMVDTNGKYVINPNYEFISSASHGAISAYREKDGWTLFHVVQTK